LEGAVAYLAARKPRLILVVLDESDEWAHAGSYLNYLEAIHAGDRAVKTLWEAAEAIPEFRGHTSLVLTTDHGRGMSPETWCNHGASAGSESTWLMVLGPDTTPKGEQTGGKLTNAQVAATVAELLGVSERCLDRRMAPPIREAIFRRR
jgi:phosphopentomutase